MKHLDEDRKDFALRQAITAAAKASRNGTRDQQRAAEFQLALAIDAFPVERRLAVGVEARSHIKALRLGVGVANARAAESLDCTLEECCRLCEQGLKR